MHEWQQWQELQTRFQGEHMKLLQNIITTSQSGTNIASSGSGNSVSVAEETAHTPHTHYRQADVIHNQGSQNPFNYCETGSVHTLHKES